MKKVPEILKRSGLSVTESRVQILGLFLDSDEALAHADIEKMTRPDIDRVTVYRTLQTFLERGIVHAIPAKDNVLRYALCRHDCAEGRHRDDHVHFICDTCDKTICLEGVMVPSVKLPRGFRPVQSSMIVSGICDGCR